MAGQISTIRKRIRTVNSTRKLTNATELVATVKLRKYNVKAQQNMAYAANLRRFIDVALSGEKPEVEKNPYLTVSDIDNPLHVIITANSGLCGTYNTEVLKFVSENIPQDEPIFVIGTVGFNWLMKNNYLVVKKYDELEDLQPRVLNSLIYDLMTLYMMNEISAIDVVYTHYINTLTYHPEIMKLLPFLQEEQAEPSDIFLEPTRDEVMNRLIPMYISSQIYIAFLEAKTSENAARRNAMSLANKNAEKLIDELTLHYNQARQAAITQEMNEIIAAQRK